MRREIGEEDSEITCKNCLSYGHKIQSGVYTFNRTQSNNDLPDMVEIINSNEKRKEKRRNSTIIREARP